MRQYGLSGIDLVLVVVAFVAYFIYIARRATK